MKPVTQRYLHDPGNGVYGDCHRAAIASVLELPLHKVPHFCIDGCDSEEFNRRERAWLLKRGLVPINVPWEGKLEDVLLAAARQNPNVYYLLGGESSTGTNHTVVCLNNSIVHDPSINHSGIVGPMKGTKVYWTTFFGSAAYMEK